MLTALAILGVLAVLFLVFALATGDRQPLAPAPPDAADVALPVGALYGSDVRALRFGLALRGYRMSEVDGALARLSAELDSRDEQLSRLSSGEPPVAPAPEVNATPAVVSAEPAEVSADPAEVTQAESDPAEVSAEPAEVDVPPVHQPTDDQRPFQDAPAALEPPIASAPPAWPTDPQAPPAPPADPIPASPQSAPTGPQPADESVPPQP